MKKIIAIILSLTVIISMTGLSFADDTSSTVKSVSKEVTVEVNGDVIDFDDVKPIIINSRTMVPIRKIGEIMNAAVAWRAKDRTVHIFRNGKSAILGIDSSSIKLQNFECIHNLKYTSLDTGKNIVLDAVPCIVNGRTLVPLRAIVEAFGLPEECVEWDGETNTVKITDTVYASYQLSDEENDAADLIENWNYVPADYVVEITNVILKPENKVNSFKDKVGEYYNLRKSGLKLTYSILPDTAEAQKVVYKSSDESVATVDENGLVTMVSKGEANITVEVSGIVSEPIRVKAK